MMNPVPGDMHWIETDLPPIQPPDYRPQAGRPRKQRKREPDEPKNTSKVELVWESHVRNALKSSHNKRSYKGPAHPNSILLKGGIVCSSSQPTVVSI